MRSVQQDRVSRELDTRRQRKDDDPYCTVSSLRHLFQPHREAFHGTLLASHKFVKRQYAIEARKLPRVHCSKCREVPQQFESTDGAVAQQHDLFETCGGQFGASLSCSD
jgi:formylmethanofuran dehydrogenase subunit E